METGEHNVTPFIHGELLVWQRFRGENGSDIVLLDLATGEQKVIGAGGRQESRPSISEDYVIWRVSETCDVGGFPRFRELLRGRVPTGVYRVWAQDGGTAPVVPRQGTQGVAVRECGAGNGRLPPHHPTVRRLP